jgi:hypothetical protein
VCFRVCEDEKDIDWQRLLYNSLESVEPAGYFDKVVIDDDRQLVAVPVESNAEFFGPAYVQTLDAAVDTWAERQNRSLFWLNGGIVLER